jgi:23S rRNA pseudouridine1911/1915/1917 synthase
LLLRLSREIAILYEDAACIALDKPAGLLSVPIPRSHVPSALSLLCEALQSKKQRALVVHRIDRFTSGILLFAKTEADRQVLIRQFLEHTPVREYLAVVRGRLKVEEGTLVHYLRKDGMFQKVASEKTPLAARAELRYWVDRELTGASLVRVELVTGFQNQIRVQFAALGHSVIGDRKYQESEASEERIDRVALHASRLQFHHPRSGKRISVECPPPPDFRALVRALS